MNAIILAAGLGTRLRPITNEIPKCLVKVGGRPMIEQQIDFLHQIGIFDICLVTGYCFEKLEYLKSEKQVDIVYNSRYDTCNNIYSMWLVKDRLGDTYVVEGDVYIHKNVFQSDIFESTYFATVRDQRNEWALETNEEKRLTQIKTNSFGLGPTMSGVSYWSCRDAEIIRNELEFLIHQPGYESMFWDAAVVNTLSKLSIKVQEVTDIYEIDTIDDLKNTEEKLLLNN